jgi:hypothetical protein
MKRYLILVASFAFLVCGAVADTTTKESPVVGTVVYEIPARSTIREDSSMVAKEVTGKLTVVINGHTYVGTLTIPDTKVTRTGVSSAKTSACVAKGTLR